MNSFCCIGFLCDLYILSNPKTRLILFFKNIIRIIEFVFIVITGIFEIKKKINLKYEHAQDVQWQSVNLFIYSFGIIVN